MKCHTFARQLALIERRQNRKNKARQALIRRAGAAYIILHGKVVGWRMRDGSVVCAKRRYATHEAAAYDLARITRDATNAHTPVRAYQCPACLGHHLTSKHA
jgi:hypothetical protein